MLWGCALKIRRYLVPWGFDSPSRHQLKTRAGHGFYCNLLLAAAPSQPPLQAPCLLMGCAACACSISTAACCWSVRLTMAYLRNMAAVRHAPICIITLSGTPLRATGTRVRPLVMTSGAGERLRVSRGRTVHG